MERETLEVARAIELELTRRGERVDALRLDEWMTTSKHDAGSLTKALDQYQQTARRYELTLWVRLATLQLKAALPHPPAMVAARRRDVLESVKQFESLNAQVRERVLARADEVTGAFTTEQSLLERRQALKAAAAERTGPIQESVHAMREAADAPSQIEARRSRVERDGLILDIHRSASGELVARVPQPTD